MLRGLSASVALTALLAACADPPASTERAAPSRAAIVGGEPSPYGTDDDAVLLLRTELDGEELVCSAVLVAKNLALTARHCVSHLVAGAFSCTVRGELDSLDEGAGRLGLHLPAETLEFHTGPAENRTLAARGREVFSTLSEQICVNDIAFVVLDRELDLPILPLRTETRALLREEVTFIGYGLDDAMFQDGNIASEELERNRRADLVIADVGPEAVEDVTSAPPRTIVLQGPSGCLGDSGGPLLARHTRAVLGIYSVLGGSSCLSPNVRHWFTHVPSFKLLTRDAFEAAGAEPLLEDVDGGGGAGGAAAGGGEAGGAANRGGESGNAGAEGGADGEAGAGGQTHAGGAPTDAGRSNDEPETRPRRASSCSMHALQRHRHGQGALATLGALGLIGALSVCRRQWRPSSGSESS